MARKKTEKEQEAFFEEVIESVDAGKKKLNEEYGLDSNRALKLEICDAIEKINNHYYLAIIKRYIDRLM